MKDTRNFDRAPLKDIRVKDNQVGIRTPQVLIKREGGEYMKGDILDANSTNKLINQSVKDAIDNSIIEGNFATKDLLEKEVNRATAAEATLQNNFDQFVNKTATKEQFGVVKVGDGLNVNAGVISVAPDYLVDMMSYGV